MKAVGILTFHHTPNYGAWLQAYALQTYLREQRFDARVVDYRPWRLAAKHLVNGLTSLRGLGWHLRRNEPLHRRWLGGLRKLGAEHRQIRRMMHLLRDGVSARAPAIWHPRCLPRATADCQTLIAGSDEIWKLEGLRQQDGSYFLDFAAANQRLISYAAACGSRTHFGASAPLVRRWLQRFGAVSVRDEHTRQILRDELGIDSALTVDPAWFLDLSWASPGRLLKPPYTLVLGKAPAPAVGGIIEFAREEGTRLVAVGRYLRGADRVLAGLDPRDWLSLIRDAAYVFTSLYHGTLFAVRYERPFLTFCEEDKRFKLMDLMAMLGLGQRLVPGAPPHMPVTRVKDPIDYQPIRQLLARRIAESQQWLRDNV